MKRLLGLGAMFVLLLAVGLDVLDTNTSHVGGVEFKSIQPKPPKKMSYSYFRTGPIEVAKVFGRGRGCQNADVDLINVVVDRSIHYGVDPALTASVIAQESQCDTFAVSPKGAIGLMQVMPRVHQNEFDFSQVNLFNQYQSIDTGVQILAKLIKDFGEEEAIRRYQGIGSNGNQNYSNEVKSRREGY